MHANLLLEKMLSKEKQPIGTAHKDEIFFLILLNPALTSPQGSLNLKVHGLIPNNRQE